MADYIVGDVQGCFSGLTHLLDIVDFNPAKDTLWLTGDLVARGPDSLATIEFLYKHDASVNTVLGNHDLHFLAVANKLKRDNPSDRLSTLLASPRLTSYLDWIRRQPLMRALPDNGGFLTHAGLAPHWQTETAAKWARHVEDELTEPNYKAFLPLMYGNKPDIWCNTLTDCEKLKFSVSAFTRMRFCDTNGRLDFEHKEAPSQLTQTAALIPWFDFEPKRFEQTKWLFGHWASLMGHSGNDNVIALDTGYVWGNQMTLLHWQTMDLVQISA